MTKDTVFDMVLRELPVDATRISIDVSAYYISRGKTETFKTTANFPSKAEASFRRETDKVTDIMKSLQKSVEEATSQMKAFEANANKRFRKIERALPADVFKPDPDDQSV